jgi:hypothetical protein
MLNTLLKNPEIGYNATLEIIRDITLLSRCSTLIGISASQIFRMAYGISLAQNTLITGVAMDYNQLNKVKSMSNKYGLPLVENFKKPPRAELTHLGNGLGGM